MNGHRRNESEALPVAKRARSCGRLGILESPTLQIPGSPTVEYRFTLEGAARQFDGEREVRDQFCSSKHQYPWSAVEQKPDKRHPLGGPT